jgi:hypothetical protein
LSPALHAPKRKPRGIRSSEVSDMSVFAFNPFNLAGRRGQE